MLAIDARMSSARPRLPAPGKRGGLGLQVRKLRPVTRG